MDIQGLDVLLKDYISWGLLSSNQFWLPSIHASPIESWQSTVVRNSVYICNCVAVLISCFITEVSSLSGQPKSCKLTANQPLYDRRQQETCRIYSISTYFQILDRMPIVWARDFLVWRHYSLEATIIRNVRHLLAHPYPSLYLHGPIRTSLSYTHKVIILYAFPKESVYISDFTIGVIILRLVESLFHGCDTVSPDVVPLANLVILVL